MRDVALTGGVLCGRQSPLFAAAAMVSLLGAVLVHRIRTVR